VGILSANPKVEPMHYGEVYMLWNFVFAQKGMIAAYQTLLNHAGDMDLQEVLVDKINDMKHEVEEVSDVLKANGIVLPPTPPERASADLEKIPAGARFNDVEIAAMVSKNNAMSLVECSTIMGQSIREDIGVMFARFHTRGAAYGLRLLRLNKTKAWLVPPPLNLQGQE